MRVEYATFWRRLGAASFDTVVWLVGFSFLPAPIFESELGAAIAGLAFLSAWFNYFAICEWRFGQTIGKNATGIRVVPVHTGERLTYNAAAIRNLMRIVELPLWLLGIGYLILSRSPRRQRLGDRFAGTLVLREHTESEPAPVAPTTTPPPASGELFAEATQALAAGTPPPSHSPPPEPPPQPAQPQLKRPLANWGAGTAIGGTLLAIIAGFVLLIPFAVADPDVGTEDGGTIANIGAQLAVVVGFVLVPLLLAARAQRDAPLRELLQRLGVRGIRGSDFGWILLAYFSYFVIAVLYATLVTLPDQEDVAPLFGPLPTQILLIVFCAAIAEELCFRGFLYGGLRSAISPVPAALLSGLIFGALHATTGVSAVPPLIAFGFVLALLYERTGSIVPAVILHAINNSLALAVAS